MLTSVVNRRRAGQTAVFRLRMPPAFDLPATVDPNLTDSARGDLPVGVRWESETLVSAVAIDAVRPTPRAHTVAASRPVVGVEPTVDLAVLHRFRRSARVPVTVDLVVSDHRYCGAGPLARAYRDTLGPLPIASARRVAAVIRVRAADAAAGSSSAPAVAALRTTAILTRRLAALLASRGLRATVCTADDLAALTDRLLGPGLMPPATSTGIGLSTDATSVSGNGVSWRTFALSRESGPAAVRGAAAGDAVSTTTVLRLSGAPHAPVLGGMLGVTEFPAAGRVWRTPSADLDPLTGRQAAALRDRLPVAAPTVDLPRLPVDPISLARWAFRLGDDGALIGADAAGRAVTVPLAGSARHPVVVDVDESLAALLIGRCIAGGASISVHTDEPARWERLVGAVGDHGVLALGATTGTGALAEVALVDETDARDPERSRRFRLVPEQTREAGRRDPWAVIRGASTDPGRITLDIGPTAIDLASVAGAAECALLPVPAEPV
ncbi:hypothetical protein HUN08_12120 [Gordonia sp. X0973]|uniref:type VII secretion protein EccE n=1 Tax=Gordonia sp. X0973 TaxID=2742602 RepID=UPI000F51EFD4|nr:type VII secretion protein EccE [Gordonia sp. X0973]QKT07850.1 hypothetical protein HUN08_12120 [Gordonia sp. X0973]